MESLLKYYELELGMLRAHQQEFAARYPGVAAALGIDDTPRQISAQLASDHATTELNLGCLVLFLYRWPPPSITCWRIRRKRCG